jgi:hypothetical protein
MKQRAGLAKTGDGRNRLGGGMAIGQREHPGVMEPRLLRISGRSDVSMSSPCKSVLEALFNFQVRADKARQADGT